MRQIYIIILQTFEQRLNCKRSVKRKFIVDECEREINPTIKYFFVNFEKELLGRSPVIHFKPCLLKRHFQRNVLSRLLLSLSLVIFRQSVDKYVLTLFLPVTLVLFSAARVFLRFSSLDLVCLLPCSLISPPQKSISFSHFAYSTSPYRKFPFRFLFSLLYMLFNIYRIYTTVI